MGNQMTLDEAIYFLMSCDRYDLCDHAFGDKEVRWLKDGKEVASGYFGGSRNASHVAIFGPVDERGLIPSIGTFDDAEGTRLQYLGNLKRTDRNDTTGPFKYKQGQIMTKLTLDYVFKEMNSGKKGK
jgi:hypothetical protein